MIPSLQKARSSFFRLYPEAKWTRHRRSVKRVWTITIELNSRQRTSRRDRELPLVRTIPQSPLVPNARFWDEHLYCSVEIVLGKSGQGQSEGQSEGEGQSAVTIRTVQVVSGRNFEEIDRTRLYRSIQSLLSHLRKKTTTTTGSRDQFGLPSAATSNPLIRVCYAAEVFLRDRMEAKKRDVECANLTPTMMTGAARKRAMEGIFTRELVRMQSESQSVSETQTLETETHQKKSQGVVDDSEDFGLAGMMIVKKKSRKNRRGKKNRGRSGRSGRRRRGKPKLVVMARDAVRVEGVEEEKSEEELEGEGHGQWLREVRFLLDVKHLNRAYFEPVSSHEALKRTTIYTPNLDTFYQRYLHALRLDGGVVANNFALIKRCSDEALSGMRKYLGKKARDLDFLKRSGCCMASIGNRAFMYGGEDGKKSFNDLIRFDVKTREIDVFQDLHLFGTYRPNSHSVGRVDFRKKNWDLIIRWSPSHRMVASSNCLYIVGPGQSRAKFLQISIIPNPHTMKIGLGVEWAAMQFGSQYYNRSHLQWRGRGVPTLEGFSVVFAGGVFYIFGGRNDAGTMTNQLYKVIREADPYVTFEEVIKATQEPRQPVFGGISVLRDVENEEFWPSRRWHHEMVLCEGSSLFLYGGIDVNGQFLNELSRFDIGISRWSSVDVKGSLPPPIADYVIFGTKSVGFSLFGGVLCRDNRTENSNFYSYNVREEKMSLCKIMSGGAETDAILCRKRIRACVACNTVVFLAGRDRTGSLQATIWTGPNANDPGTPLVLLQHLSNARQQRTLTDVRFIFVDADGGEVELWAHSCILRARCPLLEEAVTSRGEVTESDPDEVVYGQGGVTKTFTFRVPPTFTLEAFRSFLDFVYTGNLFIENVPTMELVLKIAHRWSPDRLHGVIAQICTRRRSQLHLELADIVLRMIVEDFDRLRHEGLGADVSLVFADASKQMVHKLFLVRSPYFKSMLTSSFRESLESEIDFSEFESSVILDILKYIYTDVLCIEPCNVVGCLLYSHQFELHAITNYCRRQVAEYVALENVLALTSLAELYSDSVLRRICVRFIAENFDDIVEIPEFHEEEIVQHSTREEIRKIVDRIRAKAARKKAREADAMRDRRRRQQ